LRGDVFRARHRRAALTGDSPPVAPPDYVEGLFDQYAERFAAAHGFEIVCERHVTLRKQQGEPVAGDIYVLRGV